MTIDEQIKLAILEIERGVRAKKGDRYTVSYSFSRREILLYASGPDVREWTLSLGGGAKTIDEAFANARTVIAALRTIDDENADLGIHPQSEVAA